MGRETNRNPLYTLRFHIVIQGVQPIKVVTTPTFKIILDIKVNIGVFLVYPPALPDDPINSHLAFLTSLLVGLSPIIALVHTTFGKASGFGPDIWIIGKDGKDLAWILGVEVVPELFEGILWRLCPYHPRTFRRGAA